MNEVNTKGQALKKGLTLFEGIIVIFIILFILLILLPLPISFKPQAPRIRCASNLKQLNLALHIYAYDFSDTYPTPEKWSDLLISEIDDIDEEMFRCPAVEEGKCHYAVNPKCEPNSPADIVLLFETKGGWNQFGGPELMAIDNHTQRGCNIGYNDGHVEFVKEEEIGDLKWSYEENNE